MEYSRDSEDILNRSKDPWELPQKWVSHPDLGIVRDIDNHERSHNYFLHPRKHCSNLTAEGFTVRFNADGLLLAVGVESGDVKVFNTSSGTHVYTLPKPEIETHHPVTSMAFRPTVQSHSKNVVLVANADHKVRQWHVTTQKLMHEVEEEDNTVFAVAYSIDGSRFFSAGKDGKVRVYDSTKYHRLSELSSGLGQVSVTPGHSNRVYALKPSEDNPAVVLSGGWDDTVQVWDSRLAKSVMTIFGPHICGEGLDVHGNEIVTASWRKENPLELWDLRKGARLGGVEWFGHSYLYTCAFSHPSSTAPLIAAGGGNLNEARVYERSNGRLVGNVHREGLPRAVYSVDFSPDGTMLAVGSGDVTSVADIMTEA
eukprot:GCRY01002681.1.p1 GENE.GCRY01002681.1~~GCRY01002681.1.p1  ORF type:complete len:369 (+),score=84.52 GCRY01002681.1:157-1263(+)